MKKISSQRKSELIKFQKNLNIRFSDINLLDSAFFHRSYANENGNWMNNNERLEFLGDSVLGMSVASYLYETMKDHPEGDLAKIKDIEEGLINNLQSFLLELGKGFCFVARQKHIRLEEQDFFIDLVFYNCILKCYVLIDLKLGELTYQGSVRYFAHI